jgi:hypothetical protein
MFSVPIKFRIWDKLKLYSDFISKKSIFQDKLWDECQSILVWSASPSHKHIGNYLGTDRICRVFGIGKGSFEATFTESDETKSETIRRLNALNDCDFRNEYIKIVDSLSGEQFNEDEVKKKIIIHATDNSEIPKDMGSNFIECITSKVINENLGNIEQAMKNLYTLNFCDYKEGKIRINEKGFLMGEVILEISKSGARKIKYIFLVGIIKLFTGLLILYSFLKIIEYIWTVVLGISDNLVGLFGC